jgi:hypothetical protein
MSSSLSAWSSTSDQSRSSPKGRAAPSNKGMKQTKPGKLRSFAAYPRCSADCRRSSVQRAYAAAVAMVVAGCSQLEPLSNAYSAFARDLPPRPAEARVTDAGPVAIGIAELIAEPGRYHQRQVRTEGYVTLQFERNMLCVGTDRFDATTCLWLDVEGLRDPGFRNGRAAVEGTFDGENLGHFGAASGAIERITVLRRLQ